MAAAFSAARNRPRVAAPTQGVPALNEEEERLLKLTSTIPEDKDRVKDMELGMFMIDG
jgi:hypothetical protein